MRWGKVVLFFQAAVTLIIGMVFFSQLLTIDNHETEQLKLELSEGYNIQEDITPPTISGIKQRYTVAAYVLLIVAIIELILISRLAI
jgi:hypothetical protein